MPDTERSWAAHWEFSRRYNFNHGSLGATPKAVLDAQEHLVRHINADREQFVREGEFSRIDESRRVLANFLNADAENFVLTTNITESFNTVLKSLTLGPGDEVLVTNHIYAHYPALIAELARRQGFSVVVADVPYRLSGEDEIADIVLAKVTGKTKLAIIDHITSATAFIFPVKKIVSALHERGVDCFVDGAHAPGQVPLNLEELGAAYYGGNNHKWLCAPLSSGFLHVRPDRQDQIIPAIGSGFARADVPFVARFSWQGVIDFAPRVMIADSLRVMTEIHPQGWDGIYARNHALAVAARNKLCQRLGIAPPVPESMIGSMFTLPLKGLSFTDEELKKPALHRGYDYMVEKYGFGVIFSQFGDEYLVRVTAHLYNSLNDYEVLADALADFIKDHSR